MSVWTRWRLATPLAALSAVFLTAAVLGAEVWWSQSTTTERVLTVAICVLLAASLAVSLSIGIVPGEADIPWTRIGIAALVLLLSCGVTVLRRTVT